MPRTRYESLVVGHTLMSMEADRRSFEQLIIDLLSHRHPDETLALTDVARAASPEYWRLLMPAVRLAVARLSREMRIMIVSDGLPPEVGSLRRLPIRVARGERWGETGLNGRSA